MRTRWRFVVKVHEVCPLPGSPTRLAFRSGGGKWDAGSQHRIWLCVPGSRHEFGAREPETASNVTDTICALNPIGSPNEKDVPMPEDLNSWNLRGSASVYDGFITIRRDTYEMGDGKVDDWDVIVARDSVSVVAFTKGMENVLFFEQFRVGPSRTLRELPGGYLEQGENPLDAAQRELGEETGFVAESLIYTGSEWASAHSTRRKHSAIALGCTPLQATNWDPGEMGNVRLLPTHRLLAHLLSGDLTDAGLAVRSLIQWVSSDESEPEQVGHSELIDKSRSALRQMFVKLVTGSIVNS